MDDTHYRLRRTAALTVPERDADALLESGSGDAALLYLWLLRRNGALDAARAAFELRRPEREIRAAAERLRQMGLLAAERETLPAAEELPEYPAAEVAKRSASGPEFTALVGETQRVYGRQLSSAEMKTLFGMYDYLALPPDVVMLLVHHCAEQAQRGGSGRLPSFRALEKEAYRWAELELTSYERAEEYLAGQERRRELTARMQRALGIRDRELSPTERRYVESWIDMNFTPEALELAYDRTVTGAGSLKWAYMNSILRSWDSKGLHTPEEIEAGDPRGGGSRRPSPAASAAPDQRELEQMKKLREKIKHGS